MTLADTIFQAMALVAQGREDEETGEIQNVDQITITYEVKKFGDFEITVRRPLIEPEIIARALALKDYHKNGLETIYPGSGEEYADREWKKYLVCK